jgi:CheY-like chemotaxis protein
MNAPLRILHLEDDAKDADIVREVLEAGGIACQITRVETREDFIASLEACGFDMILADLSLRLGNARRGCGDRGSQDRGNGLRAEGAAIEDREFGAPGVA